MPAVFVKQGIRRTVERTAAAGALASALPELVIEAVRTGVPEASARCGEVRDAIQRFPLHSALKTLLRWRGVPITNEVRAPLRRLTEAETAEFEHLGRKLLAGVRAAI